MIYKFAPKKLKILPIKIYFEDYSFVNLWLYFDQKSPEMFNFIINKLLSI